MLKSGLIDEVENLKQIYNLTLENQSMKAIGYKQVLSYLDNNTELDNLVKSISIATQQLAKRQLTWRNKFKVDYYHNYPELDYKALHDFISKSLYNLQNLTNIELMHIILWYIIYTGEFIWHGMNQETKTRGEETKTTLI